MVELNVVARLEKVTTPFETSSIQISSQYVVSLMVLLYLSKAFASYWVSFCYIDNIFDNRDGDLQLRLYFQIFWRHISFTNLLPQIVCQENNDSRIE